MQFNFNCPNCSTNIKAPIEFSNKSAICKKCNYKFTVPTPQSTSTTESARPHVQQEAQKPSNPHLDNLRSSNFPSTIFGISIDQLDPRDAKEIYHWGLKMFSLGQFTDSTIEEIKYDGHLVILEDGSRWEVNSSDIYTSDSWYTGDRVVVIDDVMYRLDETESVNVEEQ